MQQLTKAINFLVYANIFIALCACTLTWETMVLLQLNGGWPNLLLTGFATCLIYNLHYIRKPNHQQKDERLNWMKQHQKTVHRIMLLTAVICLLLLITKRQFFFKLHTFTGFIPVLVLGLLFVLSLAYSHTLLPGKQVPFRLIGWLKVSLLSSVWTVTTVLVPVMLAGYEASPPQIFSLFIHRFIFMASLVVLFNVRDYKEDRAAGISTIAVVAGPYQTLTYGKWVTTIASGAASAFLAAAFSFHHWAVIAALCIPILFVFSLFHFFKERKEALFILLNDGVMILKALLLIFALQFL